MALLLNKEALGRSDGIIASDLSDKMQEVAAAQTYPDEDGSYDLARTRLWVEEYSNLAARSAVLPRMEVSERSHATPRGPVTTRIYGPSDAAPTLVFVHGGGWVIGSLDSHDHIARWLASEIDGRVVSIDYSLAPEHPYPAAIEQCAAVISAILEECSAQGTPVFVTGDSAGANIAAMSILRLSAVDRRRIAGFISIYGAYCPEMNLSSHKLYGDGRFGLSEAQMRWFWNLYAPHVSPGERDRLSPLSADLSDFPLTLCIGAECDLLLDDTLAFYSCLARACGDVTLSLWSSLTHGCMHFVGAVESVTEAANSIAQFIDGRCREVAAQDSSVAETSERLVVPIAAPNLLVRRYPVEVEFGTKLVDVEPLYLGSRSRLRGTLARRIALDIISGKIEPGSLLPIEDKAGASFGVSRSAYREAIRTLAAKGLVSALPKVGTRVAQRSFWRILDPDILDWHFELGPSEEFIRNLFELRKILEPSAAALAAMRRSEEKLTALADSLARMARTNPRSGAWLNAIISFHQELVVAGENEALASLWPAIQATMRWSVTLQMKLPTLQLAHDPVADHARVFEKIASKDAEGALQEMALLIEASLGDTLAKRKRVTQAEVR